MNSIDEELSSLAEIRREWVSKRNSLRLAEAKSSDAGNLHTIKTQLDEINIKIKEIDDEISDLKQLIISPIEQGSEQDITQRKENELEADEDIAKAIEVLKQETRDLNYNSTKEDISKVHALKRKIFDSIFDEVDKRINFVVEKKELMYSSVLFDTIYTSAVLDPVTEQAIQKIRNETTNYGWYERCIIISALSLSLVNYSFDSKKANLLLDFITDFETNVWQRALTGLLIALLSQKNKSWLRANTFIRRLNTLQINQEVQEGIKTIDYILKNEIFKINLFNEKIFSTDLFKSPISFFVPFYANNPVLCNALENASSDFDTEFFIDYVQRMPLLDSHKYALCVSLSKNSLIVSKMDNDRKIEVGKNLIISENFDPYQSLVSEYYTFFNFFPEKVRDNIFKTQLLLTKTELRKHVLNRVMSLLIEANTLYNEELYSQAIIKYNDLLKIDKTHLEARWQLASCYSEKNEYKRALSVFLELEKDIDDSKKLKFHIATSYHELKMFKDSLNYCNRIENSVENVSLETLLLKADNLRELEDFDNANLYVDRAEKQAFHEEDMITLCTSFTQLDRFSEAIKIGEKVVAKVDDNARYWQILGTAYLENLDWENAINAFKKSLELDSKDNYILVCLARCYLFSKTNLNEAKKLLEKVLALKSDILAITHGNLGHLYIIQDMREKAIENYLKCIRLINNEKEFTSKMNKDFKFFFNLGFTENHYKEIKQEVINAFKPSKN